MDVKMDPNATVTIRFPKRSHQAAKVGAARLGMPLQDYVEHAVLECSRDKANKPGNVIAQRVARLDEPKQQIIATLADLLNVAPEYQLRLIEDHLATLAHLFSNERRAFSLAPKRRIAR